MRRFHLYIYGIIALVFCSNYDLHAQVLGSVTKIQVTDNSLILSSDTNIVIFKACSDNVVMINYLPGGAHDPDTLVVAGTVWPAFTASIDTSGNPLLLTTAHYKIEIDRNPIRFHLYKKEGQLLCEEPPAGGIQNNSIDLLTSGGTFYGVHNKAQGNLQTQNVTNIYAGHQGQAGGPFAWTTNGWGFLADADGGSITISGASFVFTRPESPLKRDIEFYCLVGSPKEIIKGLHDATGFPPLFPKYTLGFFNTEWGIDQSELYSNIRTYRQKSIPIDAYVLDFDWMDWGKDNYGEFRWGSKFPDGQSGVIVDTLKKYGMHIMGIRKPRVHTGTVQGTYAKDHNFFLQYKTDYFSGKEVGLLNFHKPEVRTWFWESFVAQNTYAKGMTGYWNDEADEYGGNLMFMQMQRAQYEGQRAFNNDRVWSINRNFYTGAQRYGYALWSGDIGTGFQSMAEQRLYMLSSLTLGVSWWGMDIGGFNGTPTNENYFRWIQFGAFVPVFRVHGTNGQEREPWNYGTEAEGIAAKYIRLRYQLMPYIYSAARENNLTGISIVRPLIIEYPHDPAVANLSSEWMFGNSLLVSPVVVEGVSQQSVYIPEGDWYDFHSGKYFAGKMWHTISVTRNDIPLFVKGGSIIPMSPAAQYADDPASQKTVILSSFPGGSDGCTVYDDDGKTYDYEKGIFSANVILHDRTNTRAFISIEQRAGSFAVPQRDWLAEFNWVGAAPESVVLDGNRLHDIALDSLAMFSAKGWTFDSISKKCFAKFPDDAASHTLAVYFNPATSVEGAVDAIPLQFHIEQNYPNPFNPKTLLNYQLPAAGYVSIKIIDLLGREVRVLVGEEQKEGTHTLQFDASNLSSGIYFARLESSGKRAMVKMVLMK